MIILSNCGFLLPAADQRIVGCSIIFAVLVAINVVSTFSPNYAPISRINIAHASNAESFVSQVATGKGTVAITAFGFRNNLGVARVTLFNSENGFPDQPKDAFQTASVSITEGKADIIFNEIPFGTYAVGIFHDENSNTQMDKNFLGIPTEGYGASMDARGKLGPPSFEDAKFVVDKEIVKIEIRMVY
ncbi:hypothetical protein PITCH_A1800044 [uncultured Desulfobacterium sp.]|uniref:DUF2141 domain-containing protein n=1 Tax=uncultured Desulfobacterium sp. TaxID=201089 RepID=A0A445MV68_9BACT|nr:hypothetical protein PITCH_A1800044 [uncultured Desulfobacterium sp.]